MTINIDLSPEGIQRAITRLNEVKENLEFGLNDLVEVLCHDGAEVANEAYGRMTTAVMEPVSMTEAKITVPTIRLLTRLLYRLKWHHIPKHRCLTDCSILRTICFPAKDIGSSVVRNMTGYRQDTDC